MIIENLHDGLEVIKETESKREATRVAGWLNRKAKTTDERRIIQEVASKRKHQGSGSKDKAKNVE